VTGFDNIVLPFHAMQIGQICKRSTLLRANVFSKAKDAVASPFSFAPAYAVA